MLHQRCERHDRELPYRATGRRDAERDRTLLARRLSGDGTEARPNPGRLHANPTDHFAARQTRPAVANAVMKHAGDVKKTAGGGIAASQISGNQNLRGCGPPAAPGAGIIE